MFKSRQIFTALNKFSSVLLILILLWLTVSLPYVDASIRYAVEKAADHGNAGLAKEDSGNPLNGSTEEKPGCGSSVSLAEEFMHESQTVITFFGISESHPVIPHIRTYIAFHGELLCPPPNC